MAPQSSPCPIHRNRPLYPLHMSQLSFSTHARRLTPRLIGLIFGGLWALIAVLALPSTHRQLGIAIVIVITMGFLLRLWRKTSNVPPQKAFFRTRGYLVSVAGEVTALYIASAILRRFGLSEYLYSATGFIVGLHFIGLWRASGSRRFLSISAGMCLVSLLSAIIPFSWKMFDLRYAFLGIGNALILWIGASGTE
jgi:hypothetical protein